MLAAVQREIAERAVPTLFEAAYLHKAGLDGEEQTCTDQQKDQNIVRQVHIDFLNDVE